jgi:hypothetical protein
MLIFLLALAAFAFGVWMHWDERPTDPAPPESEQVPTPPA